MVYFCGRNYDTDYPFYGKSRILFWWISATENGNAFQTICTDRNRKIYFPNVIKGDYFGHDKPSAYQGYRDICLEFLVYFYNTALKSVDDSNVSVLWKQERNFTALMFDVIEPRKRNRDYSKHLGLTIPKGQAIEDFIYENPKNINVFRS